MGRVKQSLLVPTPRVAQLSESGFSGVPLSMCKSVSGVGAGVLRSVQRERIFTRFTYSVLSKVTTKTHLCLKGHQWTAAVMYTERTISLVMSPTWRMSLQTPNAESHPNLVNFIP